MSDSKESISVLHAQTCTETHSVARVLTLKEGYLREQESHVSEDRFDWRRDSELTPSILFFCLFILPSFSPCLSSLKETIFIRLSETDVIELFLYLTHFIK